MNIEKPSFKKICLMHIQALTNFPYIEKDFDAITDYELLCKVVDYLNQVIANSNEQNTAITDLYDAFIELKDYVDNYFDNNFPELVNDKLDEMAEDGTLENLLHNKLKLITTYHTFEDVVDDKNKLSNGMIIKTLGYYSINDGGAAIYYITNVESESDYQEDFDNGLYGTLIVKDIINIKQLGAYGDGIHDDSDKILKSLSKAANTYVPSGTYLIDSSINIPSNKNLYGDGESSIIKAGNNLYHMIYVTMEKNINVHDLLITGNAKEREETNNLAAEIYGMSIDYSQNIVIDNVTFTDMGYTSDPVVGGNMLSLNINEEYDNKQNTENCIVNNCKFIDPEYRSSFGVRLYSEWDLSTDRKYYVKNNKISNCYFTGLSYNGIEVGGTGTIYNILENNIFENMKCIIPLEADKGASYNMFTNNIVKNLETAPNQNQNSYAFKDGSSGVDGTQSVGNTWIGNSAYNIKQNISGACGGFLLAGAKDTIIDGLLIDGVTAYADDNYNSVGIYISNSINNNSENIQISNSKIKNITNGNAIQILSQYSKNILISNNEISNSKYGIRTTTTSSLGNIIVQCNNIHNCTETAINMNNNTKMQVKNNYIESCNMGIFCNDGANGTITDNTVNDTISYAIRLNGDNTNFYVANNNMNKNFLVPDTNTLNTIINNNISGLTYVVKYVKNVKYGDSIPSTGSHYQGDIVYNTNPTAGGYIGWVCTSSGTPGTWKGFGNIES